MHASRLTGARDGHCEHRSRNSDVSGRDRQFPLASKLASHNETGSFPGVGIGDRLRAFHPGCVDHVAQHTGAGGEPFRGEVA